MKRRYTIKFKITVLTVGIMTGLVLLILFLNSTFAESYYLRAKQKTMVKAYHDIDAIMNKNDSSHSDSAFNNTFNIESCTMGMSVIIVNSSLDTLYTSNKSDTDLKNRLLLYVFGGIQPNSVAGNKKNSYKIIDQNGNVLDNTILDYHDNYMIQKVYDTRFDDYYLEIWGTLSPGYLTLMRIPMQSIKDSVEVTNSFIQYVGLLVILLGIIVVNIFSKYITKPIKELSTISERMAELDFDVKYQGDDKGELGLLGNSMNHMSEKLEKNISQLKAANLELKKDIEDKIQIDEMRKDFLSNVSHELKTPIALIQGYAEGLKEGISEDPESMDFYCEVIMDEANKMNNMVKKLLDLNQIEFGNDELTIERFNITELIRSIVNTNLIRAEQKEITISFEEKEPVYVWSDEYKIEEVVTNYLSNAINHCEFEKQIKITIAQKEKCVRISVFNSGKNIPPEDIENIWVKFYKVDKARTREYGGNGIGLSIVKAIVDSCGGNYGVINQEDGVEFWFELDSETE